MGLDLLFQGALEPDFMFRNKNRARRARNFLGTFELKCPSSATIFFMKGSIVEGGGWGGPDLLFQGTLGQELLYWTPYGGSYMYLENQIPNLFAPFRREIPQNKGGLIQEQVPRGLAGHLQEHQLLN